MIIYIKFRSEASADAAQERLNQTASFKVMRRDKIDGFICLEVDVPEKTIGKVLVATLRRYDREGVVGILMVGAETGAMRVNKHAAETDTGEQL